MLRRWLSVGMILLSLMTVGAGVGASDARAPSPLPIRGYYITLMRMPTFGLSAWRRLVDCIHEDGGNTVILWMAGAFRSRKFPETWEYNRDHENVRHDFVRSLIDYAHRKRIRVLLGFTPFGYDGVNRMPLTHPEWRATGPDGKPVAPFGIQSWGYNLCPALPETQQFMRDYVRELYFDFYPNADGLLIESSDYAICHCPQCGARFFDHEFHFVREISNEVWAHNPSATVVVYPHYFTGAPVPGMGVNAARQPFDPRWSVLFTPHSAHPDAELIRRAHSTIWSDDAPARRTPHEIREGARHARDLGCAGYLPSLEGFSYQVTEPEEGQKYLVGQRQVPFGLGWLSEGQMPYQELPVRVNRVAYREYARNPDLSEAEFQARLGRELFGHASTSQAVSDALALERICIAARTWSQAAPLLSPERVQAQTGATGLPANLRADYRQQLTTVREIETRSQRSRAFGEMERISHWIDNLWRGSNESLLTSPTALP